MSRYFIWRLLLSPPSPAFSIPFKWYLYSINQPTNQSINQSINRLKLHCNQLTCTYYLLFINVIIEKKVYIKNCKDYFLPLLLLWLRVLLFLSMFLVSYPKTRHVEYLSFERRNVHYIDFHVSQKCIWKCIFREKKYQTCV